MMGTCSVGFDFKMKNYFDSNSTTNKFLITYCQNVIILWPVLNVDVIGMKLCICEEMRSKGKSKGGCVHNALSE